MKIREGSSTSLRKGKEEKERGKKKEETPKGTPD
jgi:hypothetical protein